MNDIMIVGKMINAATNTADPAYIAVVSAVPKPPMKKMILTAKQVDAVRLLENSGTLNINYVFISFAYGL